jgi:hypothetical protein
MNFGVGDVLLCLISILWKQQVDYKTGLLLLRT